MINPKLLILLRCSRLVTKGTLSATYAEVTLTGAEKANEKVLGKTEQIQNSNSPSYVTPVEIDYSFSRQTYFTVTVYKVKGDSTQIVASSTFEVGSVLMRNDSTLARKVKSGGYIIVHLRKKTDLGKFRLALEGNKLMNVEGFLRKSDPFYEIHAQTGDDVFKALVYRSEYIKNDLSPIWDLATIDLDRLCSGDKHKSFYISIYDYERSGRHKLMGAVKTCINELITHSIGENSELTLGNKLVRGRRDLGTIKVSIATIIEKKYPSIAMASPNPPPDIAHRVSSMSINDAQSNSDLFVEYISNGCEIETEIAIDFTSSNGNPMTPGTLHFHSASGMNEYQCAIKSLLKILLKYNSDCSVSVFGFGAKFNGVLNNRFAINPTIQHIGFVGALKAYDSMFREGVRMSGPTSYADVIMGAAKRARERVDKKNGQIYRVLVIFTNGSLTEGNFRRAQDALRAASSSPLSVIIIGVGGGDFDYLRKLDDCALSRDICNFVDFRAQTNEISLSDKTLDEIPEQLVHYFNSRGIKPLQCITRGSCMYDSISNMTTTEEEDMEISFQADVYDHNAWADTEKDVAHRGSVVLSRNAHVPPRKSKYNIPPPQNKTDNPVQPLQYGFPSPSAPPY